MYNGTLARKGEQMKRERLELEKHKSTPRSKALKGEKSKMIRGDHPDFNKYHQKNIFK